MGAFRASGHRAPLSYAIRPPIKLSVGPAAHVLNQPSFLPGSLGGINSSNWALTSGPSGNRTMQFRINIRY